MTATSAVPRPRVAGVAVVLVGLAVLAALCVLERDATVDRWVFAGGMAVLAFCVTAPVLPLRAPLALVRRYALTGGLWGAALALSGTLVGRDVVGLHAPVLVMSAGTTGLLVLVARQLRSARAESDDSPLVADALMLTSALATAGWDLLARTGHTGPGGWNASVVVLVTLAALLVCANIALAVEHPYLTRPTMGVCGLGLGTVVAAVCFESSPAVSHAGVVLAVGALVWTFVTLPRRGLVQHGGESAARAVRRLEVTSFVPGAVLLLDILLIVVSPRSDPILFAFYSTVMLAFTYRYAGTARAVQLTTERLKFQALHDALTGLSNRVALTSSLTRPDRDQALVLLELDGLDDVNDVLGVAVGDSVILAASQEITAVLDETGGRAFRTGGDEFVVLVDGDGIDALRLAQRLITAVSGAPAHVDGVERFPLTALAGVAAAPRDHGDDVMLPFVQADIALRDARTSGGGTVSVFSGSVAAAHHRRSVLRERLAEAIRDGGIDVHYQPVVDFLSGRVIKFEALARWNDPVLGRISPVEFIAIAEESNLVVALGESVLRRAVDWAHAAGVFEAGVGLAVNVSVVQLQSPGFADIVREILSTYAIVPAQLTLELTESVFLDEDSLAERVVKELAGLGCSIAIDDFGTGYSAFGYLGRLPVHILKIDRSLTQAMTDDVNGQSVVTCVVDLATRLGLTVIVEGVETEQQADICRFIGAPLAQGWLYSAAVPRTELAAQVAHVYSVPATLAMRNAEVV
ncbi:putative bifunctional diguanylate cyclase/phosphodiesterase [Kineococcus rubinsiae]|uniref:putative bifunctional diguanylate cyclase/phosphodiesterase n=1 Tax=Kineococcus rubinsiae TaxID=2609562 RepID=UPI001431FACB|nr:bifunctional diguanylate cyclase/phosphodiesterase [Kineococcus rubinsiae]NIZ90477.1 GGDEF domain-containing protein [Kineococcus rubinsiae]